MSAVLKFEWYRMKHSLSFYISIICVCFFSLLASLEQLSYYLKGIDHIGLFYRWIGQINLTVGTHYLYELLPLFTALGYSHTICQDRANGYMNQIITRTSRKKYFLSKYLVSFFSGGIIFLTPVFFNYVFLSCFMPAHIPNVASMTSFTNPFNFCSELYYTKTYVFMFLWLGVTFLWGGAMSLIGLSAGLFTTNKAVAVITPFLIFVSESVIGSYLMNKRIFFMGFYLLQLVWTGLFFCCSGKAAKEDYILCNILIIIVISSLVYWIRVRKYESL